MIKNIKASICGWDQKPLGKSTMNQKGHSHKELMRCAYKSNTELYFTLQREGELKKEIENMRNALTALTMQLKEKEDTESAGLMQPDPLEAIIDAPPLGTTKDLTKNDKELAKDLLKAEDKKSASN